MEQRDTALKAVIREAVEEVARLQARLDRLTNVESWLVEALGENHGDARVRNAIAELRSILGECSAGCEFPAGHGAEHPCGRGL